MHKIKELLMQELYEYEEKAKKMNGGKISAGDLETLHKITDTVKNIDKIEMLEDGGYSEDGISYDGGMAYRRGRGRSARRDSMGRYSRRGYGENYMEDDGDGMAYARGDNQGGNRGGSRRGGGRGGYSRGDAKEHMISKMEEMLDMADSEEDRRAIRQCISKIENA